MKFCQILGGRMGSKNPKWGQAEIYRGNVCFHYLRGLMNNSIIQGEWSS